MAAEQLQKILLVDDEPNILSSLKRQLRHDFQIHTAENGSQGLDVLQNQGPFAVVLSDMRMPVMDGAEFLANAKKVAPFTTRVLLTGYTDVEAAVAAINDGQVFRYLTKPCEKETLFETLSSAVQNNVQMLTQRNMLLQKQALAKTNEQLESTALLDPVFAIGNRRALEADLEHMHQVALRYERSYSVIVINVDYITEYHNNYGHSAGIAALHTVVKQVNSSLREVDRAYRYGDEALLILLPETPISTAEILGSRIVEAVKILGVEHVSSEYQVLTVSAGISAYQVGNEGQDWKKVLEQADYALLQAKTSGCNRVWCA